MPHRDLAALVPLRLQDDRGTKLLGSGQRLGDVRHAGLKGVRLQINNAKLDLGQYQIDEVEIN